jgi:hypothetical protein
VAGVSAMFWHLGVQGKRRAALFSGAMAVTGVVCFWGFTVDDALISARVAHRLAMGQGYRFNPAGPAVDAVTPLGWAYLLAPFAKAGPLAALTAARVIGVVAWVASAAWLGASVVRRGGAVWPLAALGLLSPVGLWASAGMETGVVTALVTLSSACSSLGLSCVGLAAAWRPELIPFAITLALARSQSLGSAVRDLAIAVGPAILVALIRLWSFGSAHPLAVEAKPSDTAQGFWYALEALLWSGPIWLWFSSGWSLSTILGGAPSEADLGAPSLTDDGQRPRQLAREDAALALAVIVHFFSMVLAGGDWMPAYRLLVPVMPVMLRVACHIPASRGRFRTIAACCVALLSMLHIACKLTPKARRIVEQRGLLIKDAERVLRNATVVAAPDVGWVGAAFAGEIVDLAGATDPSVARLPGGHTSKRIESRLFVSRHVDHIVVLLAPGMVLEQPWTDSRFARAIDRRAATIANELGCFPSDLLPLPYADQRYVVLECPNR